MPHVEYYDGGQWVGLSAPNASVPITTGLDYTNGNQRGFRTGHLTQPNDTLGMFHLSTLDYTADNENSHFVSTRILTFNANNNDRFEFVKPVNFATEITANTQLTINNTDVTANATGVITQKNGEDSAEFGFNNSTNEAYVWSLYGLKFGTNATKRMEIATDSGKTSFYDGNIQVYIRPSSSTLDIRGANVRNSKASTIIETNAYNEAASIVMNGDYIQTIQTFDDLGFIFTDEDADPQTTYKSYISNTGALVVSSTQKQKYSIRRKPHKDYLSRLNQLNIYSYATKTNIGHWILNTLNNYSCSEQAFISEMQNPRNDNQNQINNFVDIGINHAVLFYIVSSRHPCSKCQLRLNRLVRGNDSRAILFNPDVIWNHIGDFDLNNTPYNPINFRDFFAPQWWRFRVNQIQTPHASILIFHSGDVVRGHDQRFKVSTDQSGTYSYG